MMLWRIICHQQVVRADTKWAYLASTGTKTIQNWGWRLGSSHCESVVLQDALLDVNKMNASRTFPITVYSDNAEFIFWLNELNLKTCPETLSERRLFPLIRSTLNFHAQWIESHHPYLMHLKKVIK